MLGMVSHYNHKEHTILGGEITPFLRRLTEHDPQRKGKLFLVHYKNIGSFVIAEWLTRPRDIFIDVLNLGSSLGNFTREKANELRHRLFAPITHAETSRYITEADSGYYHGRQDDNELEKERLERISRGE